MTKKEKQKEVSEDEKRKKQKKGFALGLGCESLTLLTASMLAPRSSSSRTTPVWPLLAAFISAVNPFLKGVCFVKRIDEIS